MNVLPQSLSYHIQNHFIKFFVWTTIILIFLFMWCEEISLITHLIKCEMNLLYVYDVILCICRVINLYFMGYIMINGWFDFSFHILYHHLSNAAHPITWTEQRLNGISVHEKGHFVSIFLSTKMGLSILFPLGIVSQVEMDKSGHKWFVWRYSVYLVQSNYIEKCIINIMTSFIMYCCKAAHLMR